MEQESSVMLVLQSASCSECEAGKYSDAGSATCSECEAGKISSVGSESCSECEADTIANTKKMAVVSNLKCRVVN